MWKVSWMVSNTNILSFTCYLVCLHWNSPSLQQLLFIFCLLLFIQHSTGLGIRRPFLSSQFWILNCLVLDVHRWSSQITLCLALPMQPAFSPTRFWSLFWLIYNMQFVFPIQARKILCWGLVCHHQGFLLFLMVSSAEMGEAFQKRFQHHRFWDVYLGVCRLMHFCLHYLLRSRCESSWMDGNPSDVPFRTVMPWLLPSMDQSLLIIEKTT